MTEPKKDVEEITLHPTFVELNIEPTTTGIRERWRKRKNHKDGGFYRNVRYRLPRPELTINAKIICELRTILFHVGSIYIDNNGKQWMAISQKELIYIPHGDNSAFKFPRTVMLISSPCCNERDSFIPIKNDNGK